MVGGFGGGRGHRSMSDTSAASSCSSTYSALGLSLSKAGAISENIYVEYAKFLVEQQKTNRRSPPVTINVYFPAFEDETKVPVPVRIVVKSTATCGETVGVALYKYSLEGRTPAITDPVDDFLLYMWEDGHADTDMPPLEKVSGSYFL